MDMTTHVIDTAEQGLRDQRIQDFMSRELDRQIRAQFPNPTEAFKFAGDRAYILDIFSGRFVNYIHREEILVCNGEKLTVEQWKSLAKEFTGIETYDAEKMAAAMLNFLHKKGYDLKLP
jgi:hypothetical protein